MYNMLWEKVKFQSLSKTENLTSIGENISWALPGDVRKIKKYFYRGICIITLKTHGHFLLGWLKMKWTV